MLKIASIVATLDLSSILLFKIFNTVKLANLCTQRALIFGKNFDINNSIFESQSLKVSKYQVINNDPLELTANSLANSIIKPATNKTCSFVTGEVLLES